MPSRTLSRGLAVCQILGLLGAWSALAPSPHRFAFALGSQAAEPTSSDSASAVVVGHPSMALVGALPGSRLADAVREVLERNPEIARAERLLAAADARVPQVRALPDPTVSVSVFALPPETRVGPQRLSASLQQSFPWFGKLDLKERAALYAAAASRAEVERVRLDTLTEFRRLAVELSFLSIYERIVENERSTLERYESAAQARYAAGTGLQQGTVRIQAQITSVDARRLEIAERRAALRAQLNRLRDRPADTPLGIDIELEAWPESTIDRQAWVRWARATRPEVIGAQARIDAAEAGVDLARKRYRPDIDLGLSYTLVDRRRDQLGRSNPPEDDGDDIVALTGTVKLPVRRRSLDAGVEEAQQLRFAAEEEKRAVLAEIDSTIGDIATRLPLLREHLDLLDNVLIKQARESLRSAETAYRTGRLNAVDLLDAEVVLLEVQIAAARTRADLANAWIHAERAVARPLLESPRSSP